MRFFAPEKEPLSPLHVGAAILAVLTLAWTCAVQARAPSSIAAIVLGALCLVRLRPSGFLVHPWVGAPKAVLAFFKRADYSLLTLLPFAYFVSMAWSGDFSFTLKHFRLALPLLGIPGSFYIMREVVARYRNWLLFSILGFAAIVALACICYTFANQEALIVALGKGRAVPSPRAHVRFATLLAFASLIGIYLSSYKVFPRSFRIISAVGALLTIVAIHLIAVRTGLVLLYIGGVLFGLRTLVLRIPAWRALLILLIGCVVLGAAAMQIPSIESKVAYTLYDFEKSKSEEAVVLSDAARILSAKASWSIIAKSPLLGASGKSMGEQMREAYRELGYEEAYLLPTNQYLFSWALAGILGLAGVLAFFIAPLLEKRWWRRPLLAEFLVLILLLCLIETPFASDVGIMLSVLSIYLIKAGPLEAEAWSESSEGELLSGFSFADQKIRQNNS